MDFENANAARMYDYFLGGAHNFAIDRERAGAVIAVHPGAVELARANRAFLGRAVGWCLDTGIRQFLDLGSGVPTVGNVHEIAHAYDPASRVAYVDFEPVAVAHAEELLAGLASTTITRADIRDPDAVLAAPGVAGLLDFSRPVALLAVSVLHFVHDPWDLGAILRSYVEPLVPGSAFALTHASDDHDDPELARQMTDAIASYGSSATPGLSRSRAELHRLVAELPGFELVAPGIVDNIDWPTPQAQHRAGGGFYGAVLQRRP